MNEAHGHEIVKKTRRFANTPRAYGEGIHAIYGVHAVSEWLRFHPIRLRVVYYLSGAATRLTPLLRVAASARVAANPAGAEELTRRAGTSRHQGVVAECGPFPYARIEQVLERRPQLIILADRLQDPHNLGALLRTADAVGAGGVLLPRDGSVDVTPVVEVAGAGATAVVPVCRVTNVVRTLLDLKQAGYWIIGLLPRNGRDLYGFDPPDRVVVVLGGEAGMRRLVGQACDFHLSIPMYGKIESLNASVALAVATFELRRRWQSA